MSRSQERQQVINFFYHHFLMQHKITTTAKFYAKKQTNFSSWQKKLFAHIFSHFPSFIAQIEKNLSVNWTFSEISNLDKAILLVTVGEFFADLTPRSVCIAEAIKISKRFGTNDNFRFVNKVLEKTLTSSPPS